MEVDSWYGMTVKETLEVTAECADFHTVFRACVLSKLSKPRTKIINCDELCIEDLVTVNPERPTTENDIRDYQCL